ncbi:MAG: hypothetical protein WCJ45_09340 [bacterium]
MLPFLFDSYPSKDIFQGSIEFVDMLQKLSKIKMLDFKEEVF